METESSRRFGTVARAYAQSEIHRESPNIPLLIEHLRRANLGSGARICDLASGPGHLALALAEAGYAVSTVEPSQTMRAVAEELAAERGLTLEQHAGRAEALPLRDRSLDALVSRVSAHHFEDLSAALHEAARVVRPGGVVAILDLQGSDDPEADALNHAIELLHDPTHVRSYTAQAWRAAFADAGLEGVQQTRDLDEHPAGVTVERWCAIASSGPAALEAIRAHLAAASPEQLFALGIERRPGTWALSIRVVLTVGRVPGALP